MPNYKMRNLLTLILIISLIACHNNSTDKTINNVDSTQVSLFSGERIDGPANIRDKINGKVLFTINDNILVETTPTENK